MENQPGNQTIGNCNNLVVVSSAQRRGGGVHATVIQPGQTQQLATILAAAQARTKCGSGTEGVTARSGAQPQRPRIGKDEEYRYRVKLFTPKHKKAITRYVHKFKGKFQSVSSVKEHILSEFKEEFPGNPSVDVGYFDGRQTSKIWLVSSDDLAEMYKSSKQGNEVFLWMECAVTEDESDERTSRGGTKRQHLEDEEDAIFKELEDRHLDGMYSLPQLRLWAKMINNGTHKDYDDPPRVPQITGIPPQRPKKENFTEALTGAAVAVAKALTPQVPQTPPSVIPRSSVGVSPGKSAELRMKNLSQLRLIQQLLDENILSQSEFTEQKKIILEALRNLAN